MNEYGWFVKIRTNNMDQMFRNITSFEIHNEDNGKVNIHMFSNHFDSMIDLSINDDIYPNMGFEYDWANSFMQPLGE